MMLRKLEQISKVISICSTGRNNNFKTLIFHFVFTASGVIVFVSILVHFWPSNSHGILLGISLNQDRHHFVSLCVCTR